MLNGEEPKNNLEAYSEMNRRDLIKKIAVPLMAITMAVFVGLTSVAQEQMKPKMDARMEDKMGDSMMHSKPIVAIIRADWCPACKRVEPTLNELAGQYKDKLEFVILDVTNEKTSAEAAVKARKYGLSKFFEANKKDTSAVAVFDKKHKQLFKTTHNYERADYVKAFDEAVKASMM